MSYLSATRRRINGRKRFRFGMKTIFAVILFIAAGLTWFTLGVLPHIWRFHEVSDHLENESQGVRGDSELPKRTPKRSK